MANDGQIAEDTLLGPERLRARAVAPTLRLRRVLPEASLRRDDRDRGDRGVSLLRAALRVIRARSHRAADQTPYTWPQPKSCQLQPKCSCPAGAIHTRSEELPAMAPPVQARWRRRAPGRTSSPAWPSTRACVRSCTAPTRWSAVNTKIKRRTNVVGIFPDREAVIVPGADAAHRGHGAPSPSARSPRRSDRVWTAPAGQGLDMVLAVGRSRPCIRRLICSTMAARPDEVRRRSGPNQWRAL